MKLSPSILSIKEDRKLNIDLMDKQDIDYIHLDVMDGIFVTNKTKPFKEEYDEVSNLTKPLDVHLMVKDIIKYVDNYALLKPEYITFHYEATSDVVSIIDYIKSKGIKVGLAINPDTSIDNIGPYLQDIDLVLVMSVFPGKGGQEFITSVEEKIDELKLLKNAYKYNYFIEVDGGINDKTIYKCLNADILVVGSYITKEHDYSTPIKVIKDKINNIYM